MTLQPQNAHLHPMYFATISEELDYQERDRAFDISVAGIEFYSEINAELSASAERRIKSQWLATSDTLRLIQWETRELHSAIWRAIHA